MKSFSILLFLMAAVANVFAYSSGGTDDGYVDLRSVNNVVSIVDTFPIIDTASTWRIYEFCCFGQSNIASEMRFDSEPIEVEGNNYHRILRKRDDTTEWIDTEIFLRESNGEIWLKEDGIDSEEVFVFDQNLMEGDSFSILYYPIEVDYLVQEVDTISLSNGSVRKRWKLSCFDAFEFEWLEGIGGLSQIGFYHTYYGGAFDVGVSLCNYSYNGEVVHELFTCVTSTEETSLRELKVYPNPTQDRIRLEGSSAIEYIRISGISGAELYFGKYDPEIDISNLRPGHYILTAISKDGTQVHKVFVK